METVDEHAALEPAAEDPAAVWATPDGLPADDDVFSFEDYTAVRARMLVNGASSTRDLYQACRVGDLRRVQQLVEVEMANINAKDKYDALPIYFACLCGHEDVLVYLLARGARLDHGTFEAHRCYYAALTDSIHAILREHQARPNLGAMDLFAEQLRGILRPAAVASSRAETAAGIAARATEAWQPAAGAEAAGPKSHADFVFELPAAGGCWREVPVHRAALAARSAFLDRLLSTRWAGRARQRLGPKGGQLDPAAFDLLLDYLYTDTASVPVDKAPALLTLAGFCGIARLCAELEREMKLVELHNRSQQAQLLVQI
jgi:ankyrin repeat/BTB/POZ domain-containing protein 1